MNEDRLGVLERLLAIANLVQQTAHDPEFLELVDRALEMEAEQLSQVLDSLDASSWSIAGELAEQLAELCMVGLEACQLMGEEPGLAAEWLVQAGHQRDQLEASLWEAGQDCLILA
ncbi:hypothetical protein DYH09_08865 [bacterium CPR1]|nr:hypothetical protein [bacterium CPR1]